jgi:ABC-type nitrate/sulfonate/bicarbonate transport system permease component
MADRAAGGEQAVHEVDRWGGKSRGLVARLGPPALLVGALVLAWEAYCRVADVSPIVFPAPTRIVEQLWAFREDAWRNLVPTLGETVVGLAISIAFGILAAAVMDRFATVRRAVEPLLIASQTIPVVAIAPLLVLWFGYDLAPKVAIVVLVTFFPVTVALLDGLAATGADATDLLRSFGASRWRIFASLRWPSALPSLFTGLRLAVTYGVIGAVFGEYVGAYEGLGIWMQTSQKAFRTDLVFAAVLLTAVVSICLFGLLVLIERLAIPWYRASRLTGR